MSATNITQSFTRHYPVNDAWLDFYGKNGTSPDKDRYVDIDEIRKNPATSQYLNDLIAMGVNIDFNVERQKASFVDNYTFFGDDDHGRYVDAILKDETPQYRDKNKFVEGIFIPMCLKRIYAWETTLRHIWFCGHGSKDYSGSDHSTINAYGIVR